MVRKFRKRVSGLIKLKKIVYLISPNEINHNFYNSLDKVLSFGNVKFFQLRLKKIRKKISYRLPKKLEKLLKNIVKFIINDNYKLVSKTKADGCHMGLSDGNIKIAKNKLKKKFLGVTCHNSIRLAERAIKYNVNYLAFGSFYKSKLKTKCQKS